jgi:hypothetical protein
MLFESSISYAALETGRASLASGYKACERLEVRRQRLKSIEWADSRGEVRAANASR